jgi:methyl-accepting chemotaxis protein
VGLAAARSREPFLLQTYRRDIGNNQFAIMKNLSAPISVKGRHWGAVRIIYRI